MTYPSISPIKGRDIGLWIPTFTQTNTSIVNPEDIPWAYEIIITMTIDGAFIFQALCYIFEMPYLNH